MKDVALSFCFVFVAGLLAQLRASCTMYHGFTYVRRSQHDTEDLRKLSFSAS
jgi:hypothetical protein